MGQRKKTLSPQQKSNLLCGTKVSWVLIFVIFAVFPVICKNKFPQIKITANFFSCKNLLKSKIIFSDLNSLHKNTVLRNCVCLITSCTSFIQKQGKTGLLFEKVYLSLSHIINKNEHITNAGFWVLSENRKN